MQMSGDSERRRCPGSGICHDGDGAAPVARRPRAPPRMRFSRLLPALLLAASLQTGCATILVHNDLETPPAIGGPASAERCLAGPRYTLGGTLTDLAFGWAVVSGKDLRESDGMTFAEHVPFATFMLILLSLDTPASFALDTLLLPVSIGRDVGAIRRCREERRRARATGTGVPASPAGTPQTPTGPPTSPTGPSSAPPEPTPAERWWRGEPEPGG